jgi:YqiJ-like protein
LDRLFFAPQTWPFAAATLLVLLITLVEGVALLIGHSFSHWLDHFVPDHPDAAAGAFDKGLGWLHVGRVPAVVLLVIFLAAFALTGFALNMVVHWLLGVWAPTLIAVPIAFISALPLVRILGAGLARVMPQDETFAVTLDSLVGRVATILGGTARPGYPAQAKVANQHGQMLYVMVEPDAGGTLESGASVLLVRQISGSRFAAIANPRPDLL